MTKQAWTTPTLIALDSGAEAGGDPRTYSDANEAGDNPGLNIVEKGPIQHLRRSDQLCEYCNWKPCNEACDHGQLYNWETPRRCVLRQNGQDCEAT